MRHVLDITKETGDLHGEALDSIDRALLIHRESGNKFEEGVALTTKCFVRIALGKDADAAASAWASLVLQRELNHHVYVVSALEGWAIAQFGLGNHDAALDALGEALDLARPIGFIAGEAAVLARFGDAYRRLGRHDEAYQHACQAQEMLWAVQRPVLEAEIANLLGMIHRERGELTAATMQHRNALDTAERIECRMEQAKALEGLGDVMLDHGELELVRKYWQAAIEHHVFMATHGVERLRARLNEIGLLPTT
jgi:tetratricopeptide (TPR) repeat protein